MNFQVDSKWNLDSNEDKLDFNIAWILTRKCKDSLSFLSDVVKFKFSLKKSYATDFFRVKV